VASRRRRAADHHPDDLKDMLAADLLAAIRVVAAGHSVAAPTVTTRLIEHFVDASGAPPRDPGRLDVLTLREREVLTAAVLVGQHVACHQSRPVA
jgi:DNA-binding NarL/FixJ family response regulator